MDQDQDMIEELRRLREENTQLKQKSGPKPLSCKVSEKGACSLYGLGRFPTTLYKGQWERLLDFSEQIKQFLVDNQDKLASKD